MFIVGTQYSQSGISYGSPSLALALPNVARPLFGSLSLACTRSLPVRVFCCWFPSVFLLHLAFSFLLAALAFLLGSSWKTAPFASSFHSRPFLGKKSCFKNCLRPHCWRCSFSPRKISNSLPSFCLLLLLGRFPSSSSSSSSRCAWLIVLFIFSAHLPSPKSFLSSPTQIYESLLKRRISLVPPYLFYLCFTLSLSHPLFIACFYFIS